MTAKLKEKKHIKDKYVDVTNEYLKKDIKRGKVIKRKYFIDKNNNKYLIDNKNVVFSVSNAEMKMARFLSNLSSSNVYLNPKINIPESIKSSHYVWKNETWDLKKLGKKAISKIAVDNVVKTGKGQTTNIILDISETSLSYKQVLNQVKSIYDNKFRKWLNKIMIVDNYKIIKVYKRK